MRNKILLGMLAAAWMIVIFLFSSAPAVKSSELSGGVDNKIVDVVGGLPFIQWNQEEKIKISESLDHPVRKTAHMAEYAVFAIILLLNFSQYGKIRSRRYLFAWTGAAVYAMTDEFHQLFVPGRSGQFKDVCIDSVGALAGLLIFALVCRHLNDRKSARI